MEKTEQEQKQSDRDVAPKRFEMEQEILKLSQEEKLDLNDCNLKGQKLKLKKKRRLIRLKFKQK